jgi:hypothetical protein
MEDIIELIIIPLLLAGAVGVPGYLIFFTGARLYPRIFGIYLLAIFYGPSLLIGEHMPALPAWAYDAPALSLPVWAFFLFFRRRPWPLAVLHTANLAIVLAITYAFMLGMYFHNFGADAHLAEPPSLVISQIGGGILYWGILPLDAACLAGYGLLKLRRKIQAGRAGRN